MIPLRMGVSIPLLPYHFLTRQTIHTTRFLPPEVIVMHPRQVAEEVAAGIAKRSPRVTVPRRWIPYILLSGVLNPLSDAVLVRDRTAQRFIREIEESAVKTPAANE
jgi:hypothetical protein